MPSLMMYGLVFSNRSFLMPGAAANIFCFAFNRAAVFAVLSGFAVYRFHANAGYFLKLCGLGFCRQFIVLCIHHAGASETKNDGQKKFHAVEVFAVENGCIKFLVRGLNRRNSFLRHAFQIAGNAGR
jgi:hypothetical protein